MPSYRKNRGVDGSYGLDNNIDDKKAKWGIVTAQRVLTCLFPETPLPDGSTVLENNLTKSTNYTAESLAERAREYFQNIYDMAAQGTPIVPDIEDFCLFSRITRGKMNQYRSSHQLDMNSVANQICNAIAMCKKQMAFDGQIPPVVFAIDFNNNHDYIQQKYQIDFKEKIEISAEDSIDDIASRLPVQERQNAIESDN